MRITFALIACVALFFAAIFLLESKSAIHEILAAITFLIFTVSAATVAILGALAKLRPASPGDRAPVMPAPAHELPTKPAGIFPEAPKNPGNWVKVGH